MTFYLLNTENRRPNFLELIQLSQIFLCKNLFLKSNHREGNFVYVSDSHHTPFLNGEKFPFEVELYGT